MYCTCYGQVRLFYDNHHIFATNTEMHNNEKRFDGKERSLKITDIKIRKALGHGKIQAYVTITFDDCFAVHNIKIIQNPDGLLIAMPSRKSKTGAYKDIVHPINAAFRAELQEHIIAAYNSFSIDGQT